MTTMPRLTAAERREAVLEAASPEFAAHGYQGASTETIARRVGILQPYIFRLFGTKQNLFEAAVRRCLTETLDLFERAAAGKSGQEALEAIGAAHAELRYQRGHLIGRPQSSGVCDDPESREIVREGYGKLVALIERISGLPPERVVDFLGRALLIDLISALDLDGRPEPWSERILAAVRGDSVAST
jgi:AcrR family transcriptional regulator